MDNNPRVFISYAHKNNADHDEVVVVVHAQDMTDLGPQFFYIVAVALLAELTETAEILADLRGGDVHLLPQGV